MCLSGKICGWQKGIQTMSLLDYGLQKKDDNHARCSLCSYDLKYSTQGFQTFTQHSVIKQNKDVSKIRFGEN